MDADDLNDALNRIATPLTLPRTGGLATALDGSMNLAPKNEQTDRDILRDLDRNLATITERVANIQSGVDRLTVKLEKIDGEIITKDEYAMIRRWLTGTTIGLVVTFILACLAVAGVIAIAVYLGGLQAPPLPGFMLPW